MRPEENAMDRQTLSIMKACEAVGVSRRTIYNWIAAGKVEYVRTAGGSIRIFADTLWRDASPSSPSLSPTVTETAGRHA
jgi:excisionase family DNA binding protein